MIIDALRWDFITGNLSKNSMPVLKGLIENNLSCLLQAKVNPPTVTMPRIKVKIYFILYFAYYKIAF